MSKYLENRRKSFEKLDSIIIPITAFAGGVLAKVATENTSFFQKASLALFVLTILAHYLSVEAEVQVLKGDKPNYRVNKLTGILNSTRALVLTLGLIMLLFGVIGA